MSFLVDTNVLSELARREPAARVVDWISRQHRLVVSAVTVEEIESGLAYRPNPRILAWWARMLGGPIVVCPVDAAMARRAGALRGALAATGRVRTQADMLIAATALERGDTVVTRNVADFADCGVDVFDPFSD